MSKKKPIKKEYITYWSRVDIYLRERLSYTPNSHFGGAVEHWSTKTQSVEGREMLFPDAIPFRDIDSLFSQRKCKITIEVLDE